jgi:DNA-binding XRE family transcriptional regulator
MARVNDPVELGRVVRVRRGELHETQQTIADVCGVHRGSVSKLERGTGSVQLRIALMVVQTLGLNVEVIPRDASTSRPGDAGSGVSSTAPTRIPADVVVLLRGALYAQLCRACEDAPSGMPAEHSRSGWANVLEQIEGASTALDAIRWHTPTRQQDVEVKLDRAMIDALEADIDSWEWLAEQERTETAEGRRQAAAKAKTIERFLASVTPPELVRRTDATAKDGDA